MTNFNAITALTIEVANTLDSEGTRVYTNYAPAILDAMVNKKENQVSELLKEFVSELEALNSGSNFLPGKEYLQGENQKTFDKVKKILFRI